MGRTALIAWISAIVALLPGCVSTQAPGEQTASTARAASAPANFTKGLPAQTLQPNECGLFLWSQSDISNFVFFARAGELNALVHLNGETTALDIVSRSGDIFGQFFTNYTFSTASGEPISLAYEPGKDLTDGARVQSGTLQYADAEGWRMVLPVLGARVCQPNVTGPTSVRSGSAGG